MDEISSRIRKLRLEAHYTLKQMEEITGISRSTLNRYETDGGENIPLDKLHSIASAFGVTPVYLIGWEDRNVSWDDIKTTTEALKSLGYKLNYHGETETFTIDDLDNKPLYGISAGQIKALQDKTISYFSFELQNIIKNQALPE